MAVRPGRAGARRAGPDRLRRAGDRKRDRHPLRQAGPDDRGSGPQAEVAHRPAAPLRQPGAPLRSGAGRVPDPGQEEPRRRYRGRLADRRPGALPGDDRRHLGRRDAAARRGLGRPGGRPRPHGTLAARFHEAEASAHRGGRDRGPRVRGRRLPASARGGDSRSPAHPPELPGTEPGVRLRSHAGGARTDRQGVPGPGRGTGDDHPRRGRPGPGVDPRGRLP